MEQADIYTPEELEMLAELDEEDEQETEDEWWNERLRIYKEREAKAKELEDKYYEALANGECGECAIDERGYCDWCSTGGIATKSTKLAN